MKKVYTFIVSLLTQDFVYYNTQCPLFSYYLFACCSERMKKESKHLFCLQLQCQHKQKTISQPVIFCFLNGNY